MLTKTPQQKTNFEKLVALEQLGSLSSLIVETSELAIKSLTLEGIITSWNGGAEKIYGYKDFEIIGKHNSILISPDYNKVFEELTEQFKTGQTIHHYKTKSVRKDSRVIDVCLSFSPIKDANGKIIGTVSLDRDMTKSLKDDDEQKFQIQEKEKRAGKLIIANEKLDFQNKEKEKRADELFIANKELLFQNEEKEKRAAELIVANEELDFQNKEKGKRADELLIANQELLFQNEEKEKRAAELIVANEELDFQNKEKGKRADELFIANKELLFQNEEKEKRAAELIVANKELDFQNKEKGKRADELLIANQELLFQNEEKEKRAAELIVANEELDFQNKEKEKRADELFIANSKLLFQNEEKEKRAAELIIANQELSFQNEEKEKRAAELIIANKELAFQNEEKEKRAAELVIANKELAFQNEEKDKRADELLIADIELNFQNKEKEKRKIENKELEAFSNSQKEALEYARSLIEASRDPLITISTEGKITDVNEAMATATGKSRENLINTEFKIYFTNPQKASEVYKEVFQKGFVIDYPLTIIDGKLTDVLFNGSVYKDEKGNILGAVIVARDITEQKKIAEELMQAKIAAELATMIAEEAQIKAETATQIAEDSVKSKQQFLSNMSHEIRTPMNAIIGFTKVVLKTKLTAKQKEYLQAIKMSGDSLIVLINDILDLAKVDSGKMTFEKFPFKLSLSLSAMLHLFETKIQEKNLKLVIEYDKRIPDVLLGDSVRLHQIILNLVSNAVKFTSKGTITVKTSVLKETTEDVTLKFDVTDTGIGISENKLETIFENFQQASSGTSRLFGGTGLGLAISKQLVEQQDGQISVKSELDKGSTFSFVLTFQKTNELVECETEIEDENLEANTIKVLVVEDIALNQLLMKTLLDDFGFEKDIAANGKIAIEKLKDNVYDIILMDLQMPEMNGFEATEYIRKKMKSNIPIIALTADVTSADIDKCRAAGMNDYISKPVDDRLLYKKILGLVKKPLLVNDIDINAAINTKTKCINLQYLMMRTKSNPDLMMEMISLYLEQTPPLISAMKISMKNKDWDTLQSTIHKMIPSFSIVGIHNKFEDMAKKINEFAHTQLQTSDIDTMVLQLENVLSQACLELKEEFNNIKKSKDE